MIPHTSHLIGGVTVVVLALVSLSNDNPINLTENPLSSNPTQVDAEIPVKSTTLAYADDEPYPVSIEESIAFNDEIYAEFYDEFGYYDFGFINPVNYENIQISNNDFQVSAQLEQENIKLKEQISKLTQQVNFLEEKISLMTDLLFQYTTSLENSSQ